MIGLNLKSHKSKSIAICESFVKLYSHSAKGIEHGVRSQRSDDRRRKTEDSCEIPLWERLLAAIKARTSPPIAVISQSAIWLYALCALLSAEDSSSSKSTGFLPKILAIQILIS